MPVRSLTDYASLNLNCSSKCKLGKRGKKIIKSQKAEINNFVIPKYYKIQLVDTRSNIEDIKKDMKKYDFIGEISEYSNPYRK